VGVFKMNPKNEWHDLYLKAVLETDWSKIGERIEEARTAIEKRLHTLSLDNGGASEERRAIESVLDKLNLLAADAAFWRKSHDVA
jgi:hypothetical protein